MREIKGNLFDQKVGVICITTNGSVKTDGRAVMGCFPANTPILMEDGQHQPIETIKTGDSIINHTGVTDLVVDTYTRTYSGNLYTFQFDGMSSLPLVSTKEHPFWGIKQKNVHRKNLVIRNSKVTSDENKFEWINANNLKIGDYVAFPFPTKVITPSYATKEFARLLGWYLAEGDIYYHKKYRQSYARTRFTLHINEEKYCEEICNIITKITGRTPNVKRDKYNKCIRICSYNRELANKLEFLGGRGAKDKLLHESVWYWDPKLQLQILGSFICGDGVFSNCIFNGKSSRRVFLESASYNLINNFCWLLARNNLLWGLEKKEYPTKIAKFNSGTKRIKASTTYRLRLSGLSLYKLSSVADKIILPNTKTKIVSQKKFILNNYILIPISNIKVDKNTKVQVYNFSVKNKNSYVAQGIAVHNCGIARQAAELFPEIPLMLGTKLQTFGNYLHYLKYYEDRGYTVASFPVKHFAKDEKADLKLIEASVKDLVESTMPEVTVALVRPGCGVGGLDWETEVRPLLAKYLDDRFIVVDNGNM